MWKTNLKGYVLPIPSVGKNFFKSRINGRIILEKYTFEIISGSPLWALISLSTCKNINVNDHLCYKKMDFEL